MVSVAIAVSVASSGAFRSVQYHGEVLESFHGIHCFQFGEHGAVQQAGTDNEDGAVRQLLDDLCVGYNVDGRTVDEDIVVFRSQSCYQVSQFAVLQYLRRVGRDCADGDEVQVFVFLVRDNDLLPIINLIV